MIMKRKNFKKKDMKNKFLLSYHLKWLKSLKLILFLMIVRFNDREVYRLTKFKNLYIIRDYVNMC